MWLGKNRHPLLTVAERNSAKLLAFAAVVVLLPALLWFSQQRESPDATAVTVLPAQGGVAPLPDATPTSTQVRDVTPSGMTRAYLTNAEVKSKPKTSIHIERATIKANAMIAGNGGSVRLYGIALPPSHEICDSANGVRWPCGRRAYISFYNKVNAETLDCEPRPDTNPPAADCYVGDVHVARWMLSEGLGRLVAGVTDVELRRAETEARNSQAGIWADARFRSASTPEALP